eukprot:1357993-Amorphochlora_amoeboformis.AAC.1
MSLFFWVTRWSSFWDASVSDMNDMGKREKRYRNFQLQENQSDPTLFFFHTRVKAKTGEVSYLNKRGIVVPVLSTARRRRTRPACISMDGVGGNRPSADVAVLGIPRRGDFCQDFAAKVAAEHFFKIMHQHQKFISLECRHRMNVRCRPILADKMKAYPSVFHTFSEQEEMRKMPRSYSFPGDSVDRQSLRHPDTLRDMAPQSARELDRSDRWKSPTSQKRFQRRIKSIRPPTIGKTQSARRSP